MTTNPKFSCTLNIQINKKTCILVSFSTLGDNIDTQKLHRQDSDTSLMAGNAGPFQAATFASGISRHLLCHHEPLPQPLRAVQNRCQLCQK